MGYVVTNNLRRRWEESAIARAVRDLNPVRDHRVNASLLNTGVVV